MCSKRPPPARTRYLRWSCHWSLLALVNRSLDNVLFRVNPSLCQAFLQVIDVTNLCFVHALLHNNPKFYNLQVHFDEAYTIHLMQFSTVLSHCNITFWLFRISQGSVATLIRWGEWSSYSPMYRSQLNLTMKTALKSVLIFHEVTDKNKISWFIFVAHGVSCFFFHYYIRQGEYVFVVVCLVVSNFAGKLPNGFAWNF